MTFTIQTAPLHNAFNCTR